jgi:cytoskeletal protein RodZ
VSEAAVTVGQTVERARTAAGLTVAQVAASTRVRGTVLLAIENDDFRLCGGDVYARGHLKSIATAVGLDPVALASQFDEQQGRPRVDAEPVAPVTQPVRVSDRGSSERVGTLAGTLGSTMPAAARSGPNWSATMALALAVIVGVGLISVLANRPSSSQTATPPSTTASSPAPSGGATAPSTTPTTQPSSEPSGSVSPTDVVAAADGVVVKLTVTGSKSWIRATNGPGGKTLYEGILSNGDTKTFRDKDKVLLVVGNAGAVSLVVNGRDLGAPGSGGQVVKVTFGPGDPTTTTG